MVGAFPSPNFSSSSAGVSDVDVGSRLGDLAPRSGIWRGWNVECRGFLSKKKVGSRFWIGDWREINSTTALCPASYPFAASFEASRQANIVIHPVSLFHSSPTKCDQLRPSHGLSSSSTPHPGRKPALCTCHWSLRLRVQTRVHDFDNPSRRYRISFFPAIYFVPCPCSSPPQQATEYPQTSTEVERTWPPAPQPNMSLMLLKAHFFSSSLDRTQSFSALAASGRTDRWVTWLRSSVMAAGCSDKRLTLVPFVHFVA
ncbi:hypothetical protein B0T18DRAFT_194469 [Schizothecium vesticola]|uniref:Uncharacterized protein n=1 Tax=Schizothecium vesticola TaxID=314040 RepID=A0AA40ER76_9PEZI|nr:hypothetical protein B0T18DRAFT_194469 [Schizothecium vesticola]